MVVWRDVATVHDELRITIALRHIAEHLVVGAVLFHNEKDVLDAERTQVRNSTAALVFRAVRRHHLARPCRDLRREWSRNLQQRSLVLSRIKPAFSIGGVADPL